MNPLAQITDRPEHALLLCCARTSAGPRMIERLRDLLRAGIDWEYLFRLARRHAVVPIVYVQLDKHGSDLIPPDALHKLKQHYQENAARNILLTAELCRLITLFAASEIEAIPYKGPLLSLFAYGDLTSRRFVDLDIMVRKVDVLRAQELLVAEGYEPAGALTLNQQQLLLRTQHNLQFKRNQGREIVELHWEVASHLFASSVQADQLWQNLISVELNDIVVKTLSTDDLLFSLCVHGSRHLWERLAWISDVAELVARQTINWQVLLERAARTDCERMVLLGLYLAHSLLGATLPAEVQRCCASDKRLLALAADVTRRLLSGSDQIPATSSQIFRYNFGVRKSWSARARYFVYMLRPTESDLSSLSLPAGLRFVYYLRRPLRLLQKG
jgi:hypothetical protein